MKIIDAKWTKLVNFYILSCECGNMFDYRVDRWVIQCPKCGRRERVETLRNKIDKEDFKHETKLEKS